MFRFVTVLATLLSVAAFAPRAMVSRASSLSMKNIIDTATSAGSFKTLLAALNAADLTGILAGSSEKWHVFAPTDAAFEKLPKGTVEGLLKDKAALLDILNFHVVSENDQLRGTRVKTLREITYKNGNSFVTIGGKDIQVKVKGSDIYMIGDNYAKITDANIECDNGFINIIDTVLTPYDKKVKSIYEIQIE